MNKNSVKIFFKNITKDYPLFHQKTLKEFFDAFFKRKKTIEKVRALDNVSFTINKGETVGIIGKNGAGKSTLLKLIAGVSSPTQGILKVMGKVSPLIELGAGFHPELTGRENIFLNGVLLGFSERFIKDKYHDIVNFSEIEKEFIEMPVKYYSSGMYMRLAFSMAIFVESEILLIDEILAVGDANFQEKCWKKMREFQKKGVTIIFVSHSLKAIEDFCQRVIWLEKGKVKWDGEVKEGIKKYLS